MNKMTDQESRNNIVNTLDKNIFVDASAGAGKTASLTKRMVALIESGVDVSKLCTITFTKAAANEFFERFKNLLYKRSFKEIKDDDYDNLLKPTTEESRSRCKNALNRINLCFMGTIDSFTNMIVNEYPYQCGIQTGSAISSKKDYDKAISNIYINILNKQYDNISKDLSLEALDFSNMYYKSADAFVEGMNMCLGKRYAELQLVEKQFLSDEEIEEIKRFSYALGEIEKTNQRIEDKEFKYLVKNRFILNCFDSKYFQIFYKYIKSLKDLRIYVDEIDDENSLSILLEYGAYKKAKKPSTRDYISFKDEYEKYYNIVCDYMLYKSFLFFKHSYKIVSEELINEGYLQFQDYLLVLRDLLRHDIINGQKIINHIKTKYEYYMLDESQDTSPLQTEIFYYLASTTPSQDYRRCNPRPGSIFIVGDPKQSIYRFRGADIDCYNETKKLFNNENNQVYELTKNFRSTNAIKDWINAKMSKYILEEEQNPKFEEIEIERSEKITENEAKATINGAYRYVIDKEKDDHKNNIYEENRNSIVDIIKRIVNNPKYTIIGPRQSEPRKIDYKDIMIITRNKNFNDILVSLEENDIPYYAEGKTVFNSSDLLNDIKIIYKSLLNPSNKEYLYEALLTKPFKLTNVDLNTISLDPSNLKITSAFNSIDLYSDSLNNALKLLSDIYNEFVCINSYSGKFEYLIYNNNIIINYNITKLDLVYYSLELIRNAEKDGTIISVNDCVNFIDEINSENKDYERSLKLNNNANAVKIANVHKVKGLQAPICILSYSSIPKNQSDSYIYNGNNPTFELFTFKKHLTNKESDNYKGETAKAKAENKRIDYVAATRPESVIIIAQLRNKDGNIISSSWSGLYDAYLREFPIYENNCAQSSKTVLSTNKLVDESNKSTLTNNKDCLEKSYSIVRPSTVDSNIINKNNIITEENEEKEVLIDRNNKQLRGTIIHRMMELLVSSNQTISLDSILFNIEKEFKTTEYNKNLKDIYSKLHSGGYSQTNDIESDILSMLSKVDEEPLTEVPFTFKENDKIYHGVMDLVYKKDDKYYIIDYKTNSESDSKILEKEYTHQLSIYKKALKEILGFDSVAHIYHIDA